MAFALEIIDNPYPNKHKRLLVLILLSHYGNLILIHIIVHHVPSEGRRALGITDSFLDHSMLRHPPTLERYLQCHGRFVRWILSVVTVAVNITCDDKSIDTFHNP